MADSRSGALARALEQKLHDRTAHAGVIGLGYVGLPLAVEFARAGLRTTGIELDAGKIATVLRGDSYISDVPSSDVAALRASNMLSATADPAAIADFDTINICVPTPLRKTKDPDLSYVVSAVEMIAGHLRPGQLIVLESTTYPGTTDEVVRPLLEKSGLVAGRDFFLAFSPERVDPGNDVWTIRNVPKVVGGITPDCAALAAHLYSHLVEHVVQVSSPKVAEMVKLLENTFRAVNIGLVNELALMCDRLGISVWEVVEAAATKPFGFMPFYPGPGLGGHCIPVDPFYLSWKVKEVGFEARFIELAGHVNGAMPQHVVAKIADALNAHGLAVRGSRVFILGVSYKRDIDDVRESPAIDVMAALERRGGVVSYHDPHVPVIAARDWPGNRELCSRPLTSDAIADADCVVILTNHSAFDYEALVARARLIVDTRNAIRGAHPNVFQLGAPAPAGAADPTSPRPMKTEI